MTSPISYTRTELSCPLFVAEFDPYNRGYLVVGGGGGESNTGVANTIALLDVSSRSEISVASQIDLSREEDSPQSLASLTTREGLVTFAGIASSIAQQQKGLNEHLRSFSITFSPRTKSKDDATEAEKTTSNITSTGKACLFKKPTNSKGSAYQRLLKFSPVRSREVGSKRIGAIATSAAATNEIVLFRATDPTPTTSSVLARIELVDNVEAVDLDLLETKEGSHVLGYCTEFQIFLYTVTKDSANTKDPQTSTPSALYTVPSAGWAGPRPRFRRLRWLSETHLLMLRQGYQGVAELAVLELYEDRARTLFVKDLPRSLKVAAHLAICSLDADPATSEQQILVAVAGQDKNLESVIHVLTIDFIPAEKNHTKQVKRFKSFTVLRGVHSSNIMNLTFSNFFTPRQPAESTMSIASTTQYVKLASVAWGGTVDVESFELTSTPTSPSDTAEASTEKAPGAPSVRWVLASSSLIDYLMSWSGIIVIALLVLSSAFLLQSYINLSADGTTSAALKAVRNFDAPGAIPPAARSSLAQGASSASSVGDTVTSAIYQGASSASSVGDTVSSALYSASSAAEDVVSSSIPRLQHRLADLLKIRDERPSDGSHGSAGDGQHIFVQHGDETDGLSASLHADADALKEKGAKRFEELSEHEKELWKGRLKEVGEWNEALPEKMLLGVFFSQWAAVVGGGLRDAVLNR